MDEEQKAKLREEYIECLNFGYTLYLWAQNSWSLDTEEKKILFEIVMNKCTPHLPFAAKNVANEAKNAEPPQLLTEKQKALINELVSRNPTLSKILNEELGERGIDTLTKDEASKIINLLLKKRSEFRW